MINISILVAGLGASAGCSEYSCSTASDDGCGVLGAAQDLDTEVWVCSFRAHAFGVHRVFRCIMELF